MKFLLLSLVSLIGTAHAASTTNFCQEYIKDKSRIEQVKYGGWIYKDIEEKTEYLYGCLDLKWRDQLYNNVCLNQNVEINLPKAIVVYFDGFGYFRPVEAKRVLNTVNLLGDEPQGMFMTGINALDSYIERMKTKIDWNKDIQLHYYSGTESVQGIENASACYTTMENDLKVIEENYPHLTLPKKIVMGHSNGGMNAINFVNYFTKKKDSHFDLLITIDPVPKAGGFVLNKVFSKAPKVLTLDKKENISRSVNFYQTSDVKVLAGLMGIKGSKVESVDEEIEVKFSNHVEILRELIVRKTIENEILSVLMK